MTRDSLTPVDSHARVLVAADGLAWPDDAMPEPIADLDLIEQLASTQPIHRFRRYDGYDPRLHHSQPTRTGR